MKQKTKDEMISKKTKELKEIWIRLNWWENDRSLELLSEIKELQEDKKAIK